MPYCSYQADMFLITHGILKYNVYCTTKICSYILKSQCKKKKKSNGTCVEGCNTVLLESEKLRIPHFCVFSHCDTVAEADTVKPLGAGSCLLLFELTEPGDKTEK